MEKVILHKCAICGKDARTLDSFSEAECELIKCDSNENMTCKVSVDNPTLRFVTKKTKPRKIDWSQTENTYYKKGE